ncbi:Transcription elongation factor spt6 [Elasticomyces elasticus]|nr:Transcription elongation factor spt6 [Elasticomyces elasticus]
MAVNSYLDIDAALGSDEDDENFDEETGEVLPRENRLTTGALEDSSEEEDDDDEEAERQVREGFIVEDGEDEEERRERRRERKKRRRAEREEEDVLDEEDLDLIGEAHPGYERRQAEQSKFKRLKRGHKEDRPRDEPRGIDDIFSDDDEEGGLGGERRDRIPGALADEFDDFIEDDEFPDEDQHDDDAEVTRTSRIGLAHLAGKKANGLDEAAEEDMLNAFGDGTEYNWALEMQAEGDPEQEDPDKPLELKDVFEPSQLIDKMLTDEDNEIRITDIPERFQLARKPYRQLDLSEEEAVSYAKDEAKWMSDMLLPKKRLDRNLHEPFRSAVAHILVFMNLENYEVPFIFQHRKDYLIHADSASQFPDPQDPDALPHRAEKLLTQSDLWEIFELDLKYRALLEKREALQKAYDSLKTSPDFRDEIFEDMLPAAVTMEELQDIQDYIHFQYSSQLKDVSLIEAEVNGTRKRARSGRSMWDRLRAGRVYHMVRAFGITADKFAQNTLEAGRKTYTEDPNERPDDMADSLIDASEFSTGAAVMLAAKAMFVEELVMSPRMRKLMRQRYYTTGLFDCFRTEKGAKKIDEEHPYYEFKYLRNQDLGAIARKPELYLRMLKAEEEGLVDVQVRLPNLKGWIEKQLYKEIESDNLSEIADAWNGLRREVINTAMSKLQKVIAKGVKENLKTECENQIAKACREEYSARLDQAPFIPRVLMEDKEKDAHTGFIPRILALSNGSGNKGDAICWAYLDENGKVMENGKLVDLRLGNAEKFLPDGRDVAPFVDICERRKPDVLVVAGFSIETRKLYKELQDLVDRFGLKGPMNEDEQGNEKTEPLEVIIGNDEVARLYHTSERAALDHPSLPPLTRYCCAVARYVQNPLKEYAGLGRDIVSISFHPHQNLVPEDKILKHLETAMVDMVNLVGVEINEAVSDPTLANLLPYVSGLGPRKAAQTIKVINMNGGEIMTRDELVGDPDRNKRQAVGPKIWSNCASFLYITFEETEPDLDYLDNTRIHPEDYEIARKMAADAQELDEEDIKAETDENGPYAVVRKLVKDDKQDLINDLHIEEYALELSRKFSQRKRATLETIRAELQEPFEELRRPYQFLSTDDIFTMLTGETKETLTEGMIVPVSIKRTFMDHVEVKLDCGIDGGISEMEYPAGVGGDSGVEPRQVYSVHQTVQAKLLFIDRKRMTAQLSLREEMLRMPYRKELDHEPDEWDEQQEAQDKKEALKEKGDKAGRAQRVIKHPLFRPFNSAQAEEFLGSQGRGDVVIRPSSKGPDHLAVTWKVSDNIYQHIDVLELDKENEFSVGKTLKIGGKYTYSDLDELIVNHVKAMAKKVDEMMGDERYQSGTRALTEQWLTTYTEANPKRSMYAFCINPKYPGYFYLCFKAGLDAPLNNWPVKIIPNAFELQRNHYPDMRALKNGFKLLFANTGGKGVGMNGRR